MNLNDDPRGGTMCLEKAGLATATTTTKIKINAPNGAGIDFAIDGILYHKADTDNITVTACAAQAAVTKCLYLVMLDSSGTASVVKGTEVLTADLTAGSSALNYPLPDASTKCPIGAYKIETAAATTFTNGTTAFDAAGITVTYEDLLCIPSKAKTS